MLKYPAMSPEIYMSFIDKWLPYFKGDYLEIGSWTGGGITILTEKFPNKNFYSIESFIQDIESKQKFIENTKDLKNIFLFEVNSKNFLDFIDLQILKKFNIDMVLVDGCHIYEHILLDIKIVHELLKSKIGLIFFHDAINTSDVIRAVADFEEKYKGQLLYKEIDGDGVVFITKFT